MLHRLNELAHYSDFVNTVFPLGHEERARSTSAHYLIQISTYHANV